MPLFIDLQGKQIPIGELQIAKARELALTIGHHNYTTPIEFIRDSNDQEVVIFDVEVEVPQRKIRDIQRYERIAVRFDPLDEFAPEVLALRSDFPLVPHLNLRKDEFPRSLCIFDKPYSELKLQWTASLYIRNIREWLALTARGELHATDQPLEPLLLGSEGYLVLPPNVLDPGSATNFLVIDKQQAINSGSQITLIAKAHKNLRSVPSEAQFLIAVMYAEPQTHGVIRSSPRNLLELHDFLKTGNLNLLEHLRDQLLHYWKSSPAFDIVGRAHLIILIVLPKLRHDDTRPESTEMRAFITESSIIEIGIEIGVWDVLDGNLGQNLSVDTSKNGEGIRVSMLNPLLSFSVEQATLLSEIEEGTSPRIAAIGIGALGSQTILNLIRMGYGRWDLIDNDILLPHNLARHALTSNFVGYPKAVGLSILACQMMGNNDIAVPLVQDVLRPADSKQLASVFNDAQVILDISTSIATARHLTHNVDASARRISVFLNPAATSLVILAEDRRREVKLDMLEMQYYRGLIHEPSLENHLQRSDGPVRYGTSCRDLSSRIPQDFVALHSAICSRALRQVIEDTKANIVIWSTNLENVTTQQQVLPVRRVTEMEISDWRLVTDSFLFEKISRFRIAKLPNETGGVLIGSYDTARRIIYVVDAIPAPPDSVEWPTVFIRGSKGLRQEVERIEKVTAGQLKYVGEWHSHPWGVGAEPSSDDLTAFSWLSKIMGDEGLPTLMLIAADENEHNFILGYKGLSGQNKLFFHSHVGNSANTEVEFNHGSKSARCL